MTIIEKLDQEGIKRLGTPKSGFRYRHSSGLRVSKADLERIDALKIPPAWKRVAIHPSGRASVQAVGLDAAGRWQYLYHRAQIARREERKVARLIRFVDALPTMRRVVNRDLAQPGIAREKVLAGILKILATCFLRPGSEVYADENGSFGIATLRRRHVTVSGDVVRFDFEGKSGRRQQREIRDRRLARLVRELLRHPGEVFKYRDESGAIRDVKRRHINEYIKQVMGARFSAKDFRTWAANLLCASALARSVSEDVANERARKKSIAAAVREVAEHLGNTPAVCRASYVFSAVIRCYEKGRVIKVSFSGAEALVKERHRAVARSERALVALLRRSAA
jgi:DNA topoisomerase-1